jgi:hypothetical protein
MIMELESVAKNVIGLLMTHANLHVIMILIVMHSKLDTNHAILLIKLTIGKEMVSQITKSH